MLYCDYSYLEIFYHCYQLTEYDNAFDILRAIDDFLTRRGYYQTRADYYLELVTVYQQQEEQTNWNYAASLTSLGNVYQSLGEYQKAIEFQLTEAILLHQKVTTEQAKNQAISLLQEVRLLPSDEQLEEKYIETFPLENKGHVREKIRTYIQEQKEAILKRYPHELSGGQLQRVMIAMAISCNPTLLIADEPTTALDVTVQAEILRLLRDLCKSDREMSMVFISHDLGVINEIADQIVVMYQGEIVEQGTKEEVLNYPQHPYTKGLVLNIDDTFNTLASLFSGSSCS